MGASMSLQQHVGRTVATVSGFAGGVGQHLGMLPQQAPRHVLQLGGVLRMQTLAVNDPDAAQAPVQCLGDEVRDGPAGGRRSHSMQVELVLWGELTALELL